MRTRISVSNDIPSGQLVVDEWVPFTFRAYRKPLLNPQHWLVGNFKTSLLQMTIESQSRQIVGVALPCYNRPIEQGVPSRFQGIPEIPGIPVVEGEPFEKRQRRELCEFRLAHADTQFLVIIDLKRQPQRCMRVDRVGFYESEGDLCGIGFFDLSEAEIRTITEWHAAMGWSH